MDTALPQPPARQPAFNVPGVVFALAGCWLFAHAVFEYVLSLDTANWLVVRTAFTPIVYELNNAQLPSWGMKYWIPISHAFVHGDWGHAISNALFFVVFATVVARRLGSLRFLIFFCCGAAAGAAGYWAFDPNSSVPMIGASGAVSACLGASVRFAFQPAHGLEPHRRPRMGLLEALTSRRTVPFLAVWIGVSLLFETGFIPLYGEQGIAWQAHLAGMAFGFLGFAAFDPMPGSKQFGERSDNDL